MDKRSLVAVALGILLSSGPVLGAVQLTVRSTGNSDPNGCGFQGDGEALSITNDGKEILRKNYCSAYGKSEARAVTDALAHSYVLLKYSVGHGPNAWTDFLSVYRLSNALKTRISQMISRFGDVGRQFWYRYQGNVGCRSALEWTERRVKRNWPVCESNSTTA